MKTRSSTHGAEPQGENPVKVIDDGRLTHVLLNRPPVNAFTVDMIRTFTAVIDAAEGRRPLLISSEGRVFSAGFDTNSPAGDLPRANEAAAHLLAALQSYPAPVIVAVEGAAVGLGLLVATSCDVLVVSAAASLRMPEVLLGIDADPTPLSRFLAEPWIRRMCLTGTAYTAGDMDLATNGAVVCDAGTTSAVAAQIAAQFEAIGGAALKRTKERLADRPPTANG